MITQNSFLNMYMTPSGDADFAHLRHDFRTSRHNLTEHMGGTMSSLFSAFHLSVFSSIFIRPVPLGDRAKPCAGGMDKPQTNFCEPCRRRGTNAEQRTGEHRAGRRGRPYWRFADIAVWNRTQAYR